MSKVYHGSLEIVLHPEVRESNRGLDYGQGFYATTSYEQARRWVERKMRDCNVQFGYVNVYELDNDVIKKMRTLFFNTPDEDWVEFVRKNRTERGFFHDYDVVYGPVADDQVYTQFSLFEQGIISLSTLIRELKTYKLVDQYLFHTESAMEAIRFIEAERITK